MNQNYSVFYATMRRSYAERYMAQHQRPGLVLVLTGSGEWQVRCYTAESV